MASGIYKLTFSSGKYYIGKSLDLETRWKQHFNKFATGKAARPMQLEYDKCGLPKTEVIFDCHKDHIDILEEWLIDQYKGPDMLNTTYPQVERTAELADLINNSHGLLEKSTWDHLHYMEKYQEIARKAIDLADECETKMLKYKDEGYIIDDDYTEAVNTAQTYCNKAENAQLKLTKANNELKRLSNLNWFDRLFAYKVYV